MLILDTNRNELFCSYQVHRYRNLSIDIELWRDESSVPIFGYPYDLR